MNVRAGWNYLQNALYQFKGTFELDLWYDAKTDKFFVDYTLNSHKQKKYEWLYLGTWSRRAVYSSFYPVVEGLRERWSLYDVSELTPAAKKEVCNGMGPHGLGFLVPDFKFTRAGDRHDLKYTCGGDMEDRKWADHCFLWEIRRMGGGVWLAYTYFWAVRLFGKKAFEQRFIKMSIKQVNDSFKKN